MAKAHFALALIALCGFQSVMCGVFSYNGSLGPDHWNEHYNACGGKYQSPINIDILDVVEECFAPIDLIGFDARPEYAELWNNGHTVVVDPVYTYEIPTVSGGPLQEKGVFQFSQFHFHWGENNTVGSEDRINNVSFPAELHIVLTNSKYATFNEAVLKSDGLVVMAFFFSIQTEDNPNYEEFIKLLENVPEPDMNTTFRHPPTLLDLTHNDTQNYFTYIGSMTTPPCSENVTWIDYAKPIKISAEQIENFRHLHTYGGVPLIHNFRPIQPLNKRTIYKSTPACHEEILADPVPTSTPAPYPTAYKDINAGVSQLMSYAYIVPLTTWLVLAAAA